jgi:hypothetical protein
MKRLVRLSCILLGLNAVSALSAQEFFADFALVVQLPSYEAFLTNLGNSSIRVDGYSITSASGSLSPSGWVGLGSAGAEIVAALGPGADQFLAANPSKNSLTELNPTSSATWPPGVTWSIGFPFNSNDPSFVRDAVFRFSSPDGLVLTGGTVIPAGELFRAAFMIIPEPSSGVVWLLATFGISASRIGTRRLSLTIGCNRRIG